MQLSHTKIIDVQNSEVIPKQLSKIVAAIGIKNHGVRLPFEEKDKLKVFIG